MASSKTVGKWGKEQKVIRQESNKRIIRGWGREGVTRVQKILKNETTFVVLK